jgi:hypothetical protein
VKVPKTLLTLEALGVDFNGQSGDQLWGDCPFCDSERHLYASGLTGQWDCKKCGRRGNIPTFLTQYADLIAEQTTSEDYKKLGKQRGISVRSLRRSGLGWDGEHWLIPCHAASGVVGDIRKWKPGTRSIASTKGCTTQLFNAHRIRRCGVNDPIYICEGEWDTLAMYDLLRAAGAKGCTVGVPGANTFKKQWIELFAGRRVRLCYDNDEAGDKGSQNAAALLQGTAREVKFLCWSETLPSGWDVRDYAKEALKGELGPRRTLNRLLKRIKPRHRRHKLEAPMIVTGLAARKEMPPKPEFEVLPARQRPSLAQVERTFAKWLDMDSEMRACLRIVLATIISEQLVGSPLWFYIVGASSVGKTLLLGATQDSDQVIYRSSIDAKGLISGWKQGPDPSFLPKCHGRTTVWKDGTELLSQAKPIREETFSVFRGAYDGYVCRSYGNDVTREYWLHFSMLMGVTNAIHAFPQSTLGERFLKFQFRGAVDMDIEKRIRAAMEGSRDEDRMDAELRDIVRRFLAFRVPKELPTVTQRLKDRLIPLCQLVAVLRGTVDRDRFTRALAYRPQEEHGTRLAKQMIKLATTLAILDGADRTNDEHGRLLERVALDTAIGYHLDMVLALHCEGGVASIGRIRRLADIPRETARRTIWDLRDMGILKQEPIDRRILIRDRKDDPNAELQYRLSPKVARLLLGSDLVAKPSGFRQVRAEQRMEQSRMAQRRKEKS